MSSYGEPLRNKPILIVCALEMETQGELDNYDVLYTGVGKVNATLKLTQKFGKYGSFVPYSLVINYGTAGSQSDSYQKGDLVDCTKFIQRDMNIGSLGFKMGQTPFDEEVPIIIESKSDFNPIQNNALCGSGDSFVTEGTIGDVLDMEAYALSKVCYHYDVPFISFKYITDGADDEAPDDWQENVGNGVTIFKEKILSLLK
jgi:adenosylhomocysteine nucleosidase